MINRNITAWSGTLLELGKCGENGAVKIAFPVEGILEEFGADGVFRVMNQWADGDLAYPTEAELIGDEVIWTVSSRDNACAGKGMCELQYIKDGTVVKSETWKTRINAALGESDEIPEAAQRWQDEVNAAAARAESAERNAERAMTEALGQVSSARSMVAEAVNAAAGKQDKLTAEGRVTIGTDNSIDLSSGTQDWIRNIGQTVPQLEAAVQFINSVLLPGKQDKLTAGTNITISADNVISATGGGGGGSTAWADITGKPSSYPPSAHEHTVSQISDFPSIPTDTNELTNGAGYITPAYHDSTKQDIISDLGTIRSGAAAGATAVQPESGKGLFSGNYDDLSNKPTESKEIRPAAVYDLYIKPDLSLNALSSTSVQKTYRYDIDGVEYFNCDPNPTTTMTSPICVLSFAETPQGISSENTMVIGRTIDEVEYIRNPYYPYFYMTYPRTAVEGYEVGVRDLKTTYSTISAIAGERINDFLDQHTYNSAEVAVGTEVSDDNYTTSAAVSAMIDAKIGTLETLSASVLTLIGDEVSG